MKTSDSIKTIAPALLAAQKAIGAAVKGQENPFFKSKYADLGAVIVAVKGPLNDNGITFLQGVGNGDDKPHVETMLLHESGEFITTQTPVFCKEPNNPQALGSGITYSKRYSLQAMLGLPTEDDDGNAGAAGPEKTLDKKEDADALRLKSDMGAKYLGGFKSAEAAITEIGQTKNVTPKVKKVIEDFFKAGVPA